MNPSFKLRFDQMRESMPTERADAVAPDNQVEDETRYETAGHTRNLCLVWPDGRRSFFNYAYLIHAEFEQGDEDNEIKLHFSGYEVILGGYGLQPLFMALFEHVPRIVTAMDARYAFTFETVEPAVTRIAVTSKDT